MSVLEVLRGPGAIDAHRLIGQEPARPQSQRKECRIVVEGDGNHPRIPERHRAHPRAAASIDAHLALGTVPTLLEQVGYGKHPRGGEVLQCWHHLLGDPEGIIFSDRGLPFRALLLQHLGIQLLQFLEDVWHRLAQEEGGAFPSPAIVERHGQRVLVRGNQQPGLLGRHRQYHTGEGIVGQPLIAWLDELHGIHVKKHGGAHHRTPSPSPTVSREIKAIILPRGLDDFNLGTQRKLFK